jgi:phosphate transport system substrate-binding protein
VSVSDAAAFAGSSISGKVVVAGSSSVTPVMEKLAEAYKAVNPTPKSKSR